MDRRRARSAFVMPLRFSEIRSKIASARSRDVLRSLHSARFRRIEGSMKGICGTPETPNAQPIEADIAENATRGAELSIGWRIPPFVSLLRRAGGATGES